jgi:NADP-dependent alcohol dehydrogenase
MDNFRFKNPTNLVFGKGQIAKLSRLIPQGKKVLVTYGGGSIKSNGVYNQVVEALKGFEWGEFSGIEANPQYSTLMKAVEKVRTEGYDFILAVGGGSVLDGSKFISVAVPYEGDPWNILVNGEGPKLKNNIQLGTVLTLPATGSEMNGNSVISRAETKEKRAFGSPLCYPEFSILDPEVIKSLPDRQVANGITDAFIHVMEQYMVAPNNSPLQDRWSEGVLHTLIEEGPKVLVDRDDYEAASNFMLSSTMALNGLLSIGQRTDWSTHQIGHELTALFGMDHGCTLAVILPGLWKHQMESKLDKLVQYADRIWGIKGSDKHEVAQQAIDQTEEFFQSLGVKTRISDYTDDYENCADFIKTRFEERNWKLGENQDLLPIDVKNIIESRI